MPQKTPATPLPKAAMTFSAGTRVLLVSGAATPISQLKPGDQVLATNVKTGKTSPETVKAVILEHHNDLSSSPA